MITVPSLPPEVLLLILQLASGRQIRDSIHYMQYATLRVAALVCRAWAPLAQELLWQEVHIVNRRQRSAFVESSGGRELRTTNLRIGGWGRFTGGEAADLLRLCEGVEQLRLSFVEDFDLLELCSSRFAGESSRVRRKEGLTSSQVSSSSRSFAPPSYATIPFLPFPFALQQLSLKLGTEDLLLSPPHILSALLQPTITTLALDIEPELAPNPIYATSFFQPLTLLAPHLTSLKLRFVSLSALGMLEPFVRQCERLQCLATAESRILEFVPVPLRTWTSFVYAKDVELLVTSCA